MRNNRILIALLILIFSINSIDGHAQLKGLIKDAKKKVEKTTKKVETKTGNDGYTEDCLRHKKSLETYMGKVESYLNENDLRSAKNYLTNTQKYINRYKEANCPFLSNWEEKYEDLKKQYQLKLAQSDPEAYLIASVEENSIEKIDYALANGADINKASDRQTALTQAVSQNNLELVKHLVSKGADVNINNGFAYPIALAVKENNYEITKFLIDNGASLKMPDAYDKEKTIEPDVVFNAAENDNLEIIKEFEKSPNADVLVYRGLYGRKTCALEASPEGSKTREYVKQLVIKAKKEKVKDPVNLEYSRRIVFSTEKIPALNADKSKFANKFPVLKGINARLYLGSLASEILYGDKELTPNYSIKRINVEATVGDRSVSLNGFEIADDDPTSIEFSLNENKYRRAYHELSSIILKPGETKVKITATMDKEVLASEEIILVKKPGDYYPIGRKFADYKAGSMNTAGNNAAILKAIQTYAANNGWKEKFVAVKIESNDWTIRRNELTSVIVSRTIAANCYAKWPDGHCTVQLFVFSQDYNGSSYSNTFKHFATGSQDWVDCN